MEKAVNKIIQVMQQGYGKEIATYDRSFLLKTIEKRCSLHGIAAGEAYARLLVADRDEALVFYDALNINYSEFFRNSLTFALLEQWILPKLLSLKSGSEIRIWSAGCSAGQEAYSIAMLLDMLDGAGTARYRIFATDISLPALTSAIIGEYAADGLQNLKLKYLQKYFTKKNGKYTIAAHLRERISFSPYDLLDTHSANPAEGIYGDFDLVICCNLLFYYASDSQQFILRKMRKSMSDKGYLVTGEAERAMVGKNGGLQMIAPLAAIFQKK